MNRDRHPQVIRAKEMARAAGFNPYARIEHPHRRSASMYFRFMEAAFDEHFEREAVDNIYWDKGGSFYTDKWDTFHHDGDCSFSYGRCRAGQRWFWRVHGWAWGHHLTGEDFLEDRGWADTEERALIEGTSAIKRLAAGRRVIVHTHHGTASYTLKQINAEKRKAQPPSDAKDSRTVEYLFSGDWLDAELTGNQRSLSLKRFQITKRTAKRIYYRRKAESIDEHGEPIDYGNIRSTSDCDDDIGFIDRAKLETEGHLYSSHTWHTDWHMYASLDGLLADLRRHEATTETIDLGQLKAEMAAAHPDRGGNSAAFIAARERYVSARRRTRSLNERG